MRKGRTIPLENPYRSPTAPHPLGEAPRLGRAHTKSFQQAHPPRPRHACCHVRVCIAMICVLFLPQ